MKKFFVFILITTIALTFGASAYADRYEFKDFAVYGFAIDIPPDWNIAENDMDGSISITNPDDSSSITFIYAHREGWDAKRFADFTALNAELEGSDPVKNENGDFEFVVADTEYRTRHLINLGIVMKTETGRMNDLMEILDTLEYPIVIVMENSI